MNGGTITRRSVHQTQWAAQFAVASELCKKGYEVAFTTGNHPSVDLMATSPNQVPFGVDVKGLYKRNFWAVKAKPLKAGLLYVLAYVPTDAHNRFFILDQAQMNAEIAAETERVRQRALFRGQSDEKAGSFPGVPWNFVERYENAWASLPA